jgi:competence protein ComEC
MLGLQRQLLGVARDDLACWWPLLPASGFAWLAWRWRTSVFGVRLCLFFAFACLCAVAGARRALPPPGDVSFLLPPVENAPVMPAIATVRGYVGDFPARDALWQEFPLDCTSIENRSAWGRIWVRAPVGIVLGVGDAIELQQAPLESLSYAGNPGQRERAWYYIGAHCWCRTEVKEQIKVLQRGARYPLLRWVSALRKRIAAHYEAAFAGDLITRPYPQARAQLLTAMVFGRGGLEETMPRQTEDNYRAAGMTHLLVASGQQVTLLAAIVLGAAHALGLRRWWLLFLLLPALLNYALVTGGAASIWRATIGGLCLAWALLIGRDIDGLSLWSLAFIVLFGIEPASLTDLSFQLTFAATWGLIALAPSLRRFLQRAFGSGTFIDVAALTLGAQCAVLPLMLLHFGNASWAGFGFNLVAVPLCGVLVATGVAGLLLPLATSINYPLVSAVDNLAISAARLPGASIDTPPFKMSVALFSGLLLLGAAALPILQGTEWKEQLRDFRHSAHLSLRQRGLEMRPQRLIVALLLLLALWAAQREWHLRHAPLRVTMLDVGQGEAIVVQAPSGRTVLIDGGSLDQRNIGRSVIVPYLQFIGARRIDALILTHADADHCNGLERVIQEMPVGMALDGAWQPQTVGAPEYQIAKLALKRARVPIIRAGAGQRFNLGDGAILSVLAPTPPAIQEAADNNNGVVLRLDYGLTNFLFTADIQKEAEGRLLRRGAPLDCTILKVAHHGSKSSTTESFLRRVRPRAAIISCGRYNDFGHPAGQTLRSLARRKASVFRTDLNGAIEITSDGRACYIQTYR